MVCATWSGLIIIGAMVSFPHADKSVYTPTLVVILVAIVTSQLPSISPVFKKWS